ncbi:MAG: hypothetical protein ACYS9T_05365 [Planctomycetota bacterium]|jgi:protein-disulfide isomerase-like protein with CxxC motif
MNVPFKVRRQPVFVQRAYVNEFERVLERTGSALTAVRAADKVVDTYLARQSVIRASENDSTHTVELNATVMELTQLEGGDVMPAEVLEEIKAKFVLGIMREN